MEFNKLNRKSHFVITYTYIKRSYPRHRKKICVYLMSISLSSLAMCDKEGLNMTTEDCAGGNLTDVLSMVRNTHMSAVESVNHFLCSYTESLYNSRGPGSFWCHSHAYWYLIRSKRMCLEQGVYQLTSSYGLGTIAHCVFKLPFLKKDQ